MLLQICQNMVLFITKVWRLWSAVVEVGSAEAHSEDKTSHTFHPYKTNIKGMEKIEIYGPGSCKKDNHVKKKIILSPPQKNK